MARVQNPIIGQAVNKAGGMIFSNWKQLKVMRSAPLAVANPNTPAQQAVRRRMALLASTMREILQTIRVGFVKYQNGTTQWAQFIKENYATATSDNGTAATLLPSAFKFSKGSLLSPGLVSIGSVSGQDIPLSWVDNSGQPGAAATDKLYVVMINSNSSAVAAIATNATRADEAYTVDAPVDINTGACNVYTFFVNVAGDDVSDSAEAEL